MPTKSELEAAFRATGYQLFLPSGAVVLRVDQAAPAFAQWLQQESVSSWAILTAFNPASRRLGDDENAERQAKLEIALLERGFEPYAGENVAEDAAWPAEQTCLVPNISLLEAVGFGRQFEQNAIIHGGSDGVPHLIWVDREA